MSRIRSSSDASNCRPQKQHTSAVAGPRDGALVEVAPTLGTEAEFRRAFSERGTAWQDFVRQLRENDEGFDRVDAFVAQMVMIRPRGRDWLAGVGLAAFLPLNLVDGGAHDEALQNLADRILEAEARNVSTRLDAVIGRLKTLLEA